MIPIWHPSRQPARLLPCTWVARGINIGLATRMYFSDEEAANNADPVLNIVEPDIRRRTLIAQREMRGAGAVYTFDIYLQGDRETVFFDV